MNTVLVIAAADETRDAWCLAFRKRGMACKKATALLGVLDELVDGSLAGIVFQSRSEADLAELAALSTTHPLPPVVIVSGPIAAPVASRFVAGTIVDPTTSAATIVDLLSCMVKGRPLTSPTHLPVRLNRVLRTQWTVRLSAKPIVPHDDFDGATHPDGFDLARA